MEQNALVGQWEKTGFLEGAETQLDKNNLAILLENCRLLKEATNTGLPSENLYYLTQKGFLLSKFRKMVSVQPMIGPCAMVYWAKQTEKNVTIESESVTAKTFKLNFNLFDDKYFNELKDIYAEAVAAEIDSWIVKELPRVNLDNLEKLTGTKLGWLYDYVIAPHSTIEKLKTNLDVDGVDIHEIPTILDEDSFLPIGCAGRYRLDNFGLPIFAPYILISAAPKYINSTRGLIGRAGFYK